MYGMSKTFFGGAPTRDRTNVPNDSAWRYWRIRIPAFKWAWPSWKYGPYNPNGSWNTGGSGMGYSTAGGNIKIEDPYINFVGEGGSDPSFYWLGYSGSDLPDTMLGQKEQYWAWHTRMSGLEIYEGWGRENLFLTDTIKIESTYFPSGFFDIQRELYRPAGKSMSVAEVDYPLPQINSGGSFTIDLRKRTRLRGLGMSSTVMWNGFEILASNDKVNWTLVLERTPQEFKKDFRWVAGIASQPWVYDLIANQPAHAPVDSAGYRYWGVVVNSIGQPGDTESSWRVNFMNPKYPPFRVRLSRTKGAVGAWSSEFCMELYSKMAKYANLDWLLNKNFQAGDVYPQAYSYGGAFTENTNDGFGFPAGTMFVYDYGAKATFNYVSMDAARQLVSYTVLASNDRVRWRSMKYVLNDCLCRSE